MSEGVDVSEPRHAGPPRPFRLTNTFRGPYDWRSVAQTLLISVPLVALGFGASWWVLVLVIVGSQALNWFVVPRERDSTTTGQSSSEPEART